MTPSPVSQGLVPSLTERDFDAEVLASPLPVLVDFTTAWCAPCRALAPILHGLAAERAGSLKIVAIDGDACAGLAARLRIKAFPTLLVFVGGIEVARRVGLSTRERILTMIDERAAPMAPRPGALSAAPR